MVRVSAQVQTWLTGYNAQQSIKSLQAEYPLPLEAIYLNGKRVFASCMDEVICLSKYWKAGETIQIQLSCLVNGVHRHVDTS